MYVVGITGGIGSGKSTVAELFRAQGIPVYDADVEAHALAGPGQPAMAKIVAEFGPSVLAADQSIDRARLRDLVFNDASARHRLEAILHPLVKEALGAKAAQGRAPYCIVVVPLLFEAHYTDLVNRVLVVDAPESEQMRRTLQRPGMTPEIAQRIIAAQWSREQRRAHADDVIMNDAGIDQLRSRVNALHAHYLSAALQP